WFDKTGCVQAQGGLRVVLIEAPLIPSFGSLTPSSKLPWRGRVYASDGTNAVNVYFDPWEISTYAWATIPRPAAGRIMRRDKLMQFKRSADAERWYAQNITDRLKPYIPHTVTPQGAAFQLLLGPAAFGTLDTACPIDGKPSCNIIGGLPH